MTSTEVYERPTLNSVHFEARYPTLFYLNDKIGELQLKIIDDFPKSSQIIQQDIIMGPDNVPQSQEQIKIWRFEKSSQKTRIDIRSDRLIISSFEYKSYNFPGETKFRDILEKTISNFLSVIPLTEFSRVGFRYIDHCPLEQKTTEYFKGLYNPPFCIDRYKIEDIRDYALIIRVMQDRYSVTFRSGIQKAYDEEKYILDFDGFIENIPVNQYLTVADDLHELIKKEYNNNITDNLRAWMKKK